MKPATYTTRTQGNRVVIYRHSVHYPRGVFASRARTQDGAEFWIALQSKEDRDTRAAKVADYIAERAARVPLAPIDYGQLSLAI